jgi:hypothetical protein
VVVVCCGADDDRRGVQVRTSFDACSAINARGGRRLSTPGVADDQYRRRTGVSSRTVVGLRSRDTRLRDHVGDDVRCGARQPRQPQPPEKQPVLSVLRRLQRPAALQRHASGAVLPTARSPVFGDRHDVVLVVTRHDRSGQHRIPQWDVFVDTVSKRRSMHGWQRVFVCCRMERRHLHYSGVFDGMFDECVLLRSGHVHVFRRVDGCSGVHDTGMQFGVSEWRRMHRAEYMCMPAALFRHALYKQYSRYAHCRFSIALTHVHTCCGIGPSSISVYVEESILFVAGRNPQTCASGNAYQAGILNDGQSWEPPGVQTVFTYHALTNSINTTCLYGTCDIDTVSLPLTDTPVVIWKHVVIAGCVQLSIKAGPAISSPVLSNIVISCLACGGAVVVLIGFVMWRRTHAEKPPVLVVLRQLDTPRPQPGAHDSTPARSLRPLPTTELSSVLPDFRKAPRKTGVDESSTRPVVAADAPGVIHSQV